MEFVVVFDTKLQPVSKPIGVDFVNQIREVYPMVKLSDIRPKTETINPKVRVVVDFENAVVCGRFKDKNEIEFNVAHASNKVLKTVVRSFKDGTYGIGYEYDTNLLLELWEKSI